MIKGYRLRIRLYRKLDKDLMTLYRHPDFHLIQAVREAVTMSARGEGGYIRLPKARDDYDFPKRIEFNVDIPPEDQDVIAWCKSIPSGFRNDTAKNLVRGYLTGPVIGAFLGNSRYDNLAFFNSEKKPMKDAIKRSRQPNSLKMEKYAEIEKILQKSGQSPEALLALLKEEKDSDTESAASSTSSQIKRTQQPFSQQATEPETFENSDFDLFAAVDKILK